MFRSRNAGPGLLLFFLQAWACATSVAFYDQLQWRLIGPFRGGRVIAVSGVPGDHSTAYFGSVGGGVWKTDDAGVTWTPIFDQQHIASIGAIAVAPSNPNVIYAGSGEADMRSQIGFGDGVYKSTDAGKTWKNVGLRDSRQIARIVVAPYTPDTVYVAVLGHAYGPNAERGVFRSTNGGATWQKILDRGPDVGAVDLAFDPENPRVLYATVWNGKRPPWSVYAPIEGPGSGMFKSTNGGDNWTQLSGHGLPADGRRSGVATASGHRVYALIDAPRDGGLYRSDDAGENWTRVSSDPRLTSRGWYFSGITVDPKNPDLVYVPNVALYRSSDGGKSFTVLKGAPGGDDYHVLWIDPADSRHLILGSDQGTNVSLNAGKTWSSWYNQPTAQFYHVITDNQFPYWVYGAQQDSGTASVASRTNHGEIDARDWESVGGEESGYIAIDPKNPNIVYAGDTTGTLNRFDKRTGQAQNITPWPMRGGGLSGNISQQKYRFPWTAPLIFSPVEPGTLYYGSQYLLKTTDGGLSWREISPDLTGDARKDKPVSESEPVTPENARARGYGVIYSIAPSHLNAATIWVGSDTGLLHLTRDGGKTWENITPKGLPDWSRVTQIEASHFDPATAYAAVDRHRREDYKPYVYRTRDYGKTWTPIVNGLEEPAYVNSIKEDPERKGLLYAATELGVAVSFDDGDQWQSLQLNLPVVSVRDLVIHGDDLVIATHGRAFWILDNISPLRQIESKLVSEDAWLYKPATAIRLNPESFSGTPFPPEEPKAKNPPDGAILDYYFKSPPQGEVVLDILDSKNRVIRHISSNDRPEPPARAVAIADYWTVPPPRLSAKAGMTRFVWDLRYDLQSEGGGRNAARGPLVLPGSYQVRLTADGHSYTQPLKVALDPRSRATPAELSKQLDFCLSVVKAIGEARKLNTDAGRRIIAEMTAALNAAESADRPPPAQAVQLFNQAMAGLKKLQESSQPSKRDGR